VSGGHSIVQVTISAITGKTRKPQKLLSGQTVLKCWDTQTAW
jgi:hypothetical protein